MWLHFLKVESIFGKFPEYNRLERIEAVHMTVGRPCEELD